MRLGTGLGMPRPPCLSCLAALVLGSQICPSSSPRSRRSRRGMVLSIPVTETHRCPMHAHPPGLLGLHTRPQETPTCSTGTSFGPKPLVPRTQDHKQGRSSRGGTGVWQPQHSSTHARHPGGSAELGVITQLTCCVMSASCRHTTLERITGSGRDSARESKRGALHKLSESQLPPRNGPSDPFSGSL